MVTGYVDSKFGASSLKLTDMTHDTFVTPRQVATGHFQRSLYLDRFIWSQAMWIPNLVPQA